jgi:antitoxin VapB
LVYIAAVEDSMAIAKAFWSGRSQAVRLPKEYRFDTDEVHVRRLGAAIVLEPISRDWAWLDDVVGPFDTDFVAATEEEVPAQSRPSRDRFE